MSGPVQRWVSVADYGAPDLTSRSRAHRLLKDIGQSRDVVLDFEKVQQIGPGFADEIFHIYKEQHPEVHIAYTNVTPAIRRAIKDAVVNLHQDQIP